MDPDCGICVLCLSDYTVSQRAGNQGNGICVTLFWITDRRCLEQAAVFLFFAEHTFLCTMGNFVGTLPVSGQRDEADPDGNDL